MAQLVFEKVAGKRVGNYCTHPTVNVEVLEGRPRHCEHCGGEVRYENPNGYFGKWVHVGEAGECRYATPQSHCVYCGAEGKAEGVEFHQHAWYDATECARCGGVNGFAIGD